MVYNRCNSMTKFLLSSLLLFSCGWFLLWTLAICCLKLFLLHTTVLKEEVDDKKRWWQIHPELNYLSKQGRLVFLHIFLFLFCALQLRERFSAHKKHLLLQLVKDSGNSQSSYLMHWNQTLEGYKHLGNTGQFKKLTF